MPRGRKKKVDNIIFCIGMAMKLENDAALSSVQLIKGTKQECIEAINKYLICHYYDTNCCYKYLYVNLSIDMQTYDDIIQHADAFYAFCHNFTNWFSLDEFIAAGKITLS